MKLTVDKLAELAIDVQTEDTIDWEMLRIDKEVAYKLIASSIHEEFVKDDVTVGDYYALLACLVNLTVENFALNLKLHTGNF